MLRLCSSSLVRQEILSNAGIPFILAENGFDEEQLSNNCPKSFAYQAALGKATYAKERYGLEIPLLIADSVVSCDGILQRKAKSMQEARDFLLAQSGGIVSVISCMILYAKQFSYVDLNQTCFSLDTFKQQDMESYLQSGVWRGKAGAVMVEGFHKRYIKSQTGATSNAMGLHIESLLPFLKSIV